MPKNGEREVFGMPVALGDFQKSNGLDRSVHLVMPGGPSLTRQEFADECDINSIMAKYESHLADPMKSVREPIYYDFTASPSSLMEAMDIMARGQEAFMRLPATVRREFDNDPAQFVDFASDPANVDQLVEWGLAERKEVPAPGPELMKSPREVAQAAAFDQAVEAAASKKAPPGGSSEPPGGDKKG